MLPLSVSASGDANKPSLMALASCLRAEDHFSPPLCEEHGAEWRKRRISRCSAALSLCSRVNSGPENSLVQ